MCFERKSKTTQIVYYVKNWQIRDGVHTDMGPWFFRHKQRHKKNSRSTSRGFGPSSHMTGFNISLNVRKKSRLPIMMTRHENQRTVKFRVAAQSSIMTPGQNVTTQILRSKHFPM